MGNAHLLVPNRDKLLNIDIYMPGEISFGAI